MKRNTFEWDTEGAYGGDETKPPVFAIIYPDMFRSPAYRALNPTAMQLLLDMIFEAEGGKTFYYPFSKARDEGITSSKRSFYDAIHELEGKDDSHPYRFIEATMSPVRGTMTEYSFIDYNEEGSWYSSWDDFCKNPEKLTKGKYIWQKWKKTKKKIKNNYK